MFGLHRVRPRPLTFRRVRAPCKRTFIQAAGNGFLDLALALPIPPSLPPYSTTIILVTVLSRLALLPVSFWAKARMIRQESVIQELHDSKDILSKRVLHNLKASGVRGNKEELNILYRKQLEDALKTHHQQLIKKHDANPLPTMLAPPLVQLPVFVAFTVVLNRLSVAPTPFDSESFLTLASLAHPDPTWTLPVALGLITMANVESSQWFISPAERVKLQEMQAAEGRQLSDAKKMRLFRGVVWKNFLRGLSVVRIIVAATTPGSVALYWTTSAVFGLIQTWFFERADAIRRQKRLPTATK